ncbi:MAG TPA: cytochrome P460 family protein [Terracidiphilus sp.]|nr:cytochrome P460 family protein [Terracidiphilus sp.]
MRLKIVFAAGFSLLTASLLFLLRTTPVVHATDADSPAYASNGDMLPPGSYREWIYLSSGIDMSYTANPAGMTMFDNVFVNPAAYRSYLAAGTWPDKTVMVLETREAVSKGSINQHGHYQGTSVMGLEVHVKDASRFKGGWAFFDFASPTANGKLFPTTAVCYSCHADHAAVDTTFVQFYPTLLPIAQQKKTLSDAFLKETSAQATGK